MFFVRVLKDMCIFLILFVGWFVLCCVESNLSAWIIENYLLISKFFQVFVILGITVSLRFKHGTDPLVEFHTNYRRRFCFSWLYCPSLRNVTMWPASPMSLILRRSRTGTVWFYTSTSNKRAARPKLYTKSLTRDLKRMYSLLTLVRTSINL